MSFSDFLRYKVCGDNVVIRPLFELAHSKAFNSRATTLALGSLATLAGLYTFHAVNPQAFNKSVVYLTKKAQDTGEVMRHIYQRGLLQSFGDLFSWSKGPKEPEFLQEWKDELSDLALKFVPIINAEACSILNPLYDEDSKKFATSFKEDLLQEAIKELLYQLLPPEGFFKDLSSEDLKQKKQFLNQQIFELLFWLSQENMDTVETGILGLHYGYKFKTWDQWRNGGVFDMLNPLTPNPYSYAPEDASPKQNLLAKAQKLAPELAKYIAKHVSTTNNEHNSPSNARFIKKDSIHTDHLRKTSLGASQLANHPNQAELTKLCKAISEKIDERLEVAKRAWERKHPTPTPTI